MGNIVDGVSLKDKIRGRYFISNVDDSLPCISVETTGLAEGWETAVWATWCYGAQIATPYDQPGDPLSRDCNLTLVVKNPFADPRIHRNFPGGFRDLIKYEAEMVYGLEDWRVDRSDPQKWDYHYHERLAGYEVIPIDILDRARFNNEDEEQYIPLQAMRRIDQIQYIIDDLSATPYSRRAQAITWNPSYDPGKNEPPCFLSGTMIATPQGPRPIETLKNGDEVYAFNLHDGWLQRDVVSDYFTRQEKSVCVNLIGGHSISVSAKQLLLSSPTGSIDSARWVEAQSLKPGDQIVLSSLRSDAEITNYMSTGYVLGVAGVLARSKEEVENLLNMSGEQAKEFLTGIFSAIGSMATLSKNRPCLRLKTNCKQINSIVSYSLNKIGVAFETPENGSIIISQLDAIERALSFFDFRLNGRKQARFLVFRAILTESFLTFSRLKMAIAAVRNKQKAGISVEAIKEEYNEYGFSSQWLCPDYAPSFKIIENEAFHFYNYCCLPVKSIEDIGEQTVYDFAVSHKDHAIIANGIVAHNCLQRIWCRIFDNKLVMAVDMRSNDAYKAAFMNMWAFTAQQKYIARRISENIGYKIEVGAYIHRANSFHIYGRDYRRTVVDGKETGDFAFNLFLNGLTNREFEARTYSLKDPMIAKMLADEEQAVRDLHVQYCLNLGMKNPTEQENWFRH